MAKTIALFIGGLLAAYTSTAGVFTQWNFNSNPKDYKPGTGTTDPSVGSGSLSCIGGIGLDSFVGSSSSDPALSNDDSAYHLYGFPSSTGPNLSAGLQFNVDTSGWQDITISWDQKNGSSASGYARLQYTLDLHSGNWISAGSEPFSSSTTGWYSRSIDLSTIVGVANNPNFGFRIVSEYAPGTSSFQGTTGTYNAGSTWDFDMVTVSGMEVVPVPEVGVSVTAAAFLVVVIGVTERRRLCGLISKKG